MSRIRILIADDNDDMIQLILDLLRPEFDVVGVERDGQELASTAKALNPDVIITDFTMPRMDGLTAARLIIDENPDARIIILTVHNAPTIARKSLEAGILGYVLKMDALQELTQAVYDVYQGKRFVSAKITGIDFPDPNQH